MIFNFLCSKFIYWIGQASLTRGWRQIFTKWKIITRSFRRTLCTTKTYFWMWWKPTKLAQFQRQELALNVVKSDLIDTRKDRVTTTIRWNWFEITQEMSQCFVNVFHSYVFSIILTMNFFEITSFATKFYTKMV